MQQRGEPKMRIRIKTYNGELPSYLTVGKAYEVVGYYGIFPDKNPLILDDNKDQIAIVLNKSSHLNGGSWEMCDD